MISERNIASYINPLPIKIRECFLRIAASPQLSMLPGENFFAKVCSPSALKISSAVMVIEPKRQNSFSPAIFL